MRDKPTVSEPKTRTGMRFLEEQGRFDAAAERFRGVVSIDPTDDQARRALGRVLMRLNRRPDAGTAGLPE